MKYRNRISAILAAIVLSLTMTVPCAAGSSTMLHACVPDSVTLQIRIHGKGKISIGGTVIAGSCELPVDRLVETELLLLPEAPNKPLSVKLDGLELLPQFSGNRCVMQSPGLDAVLDVFFTSYPASPSDNPKTGDYGFTHACNALVLSACAIVFISCKNIKRRRKK